MFTPIPDRDLALKTYRYLRMGMVGLVVALAVSILLERLEVDCWQTSISSYYYTPVRAVFVGGLMAIGASLLVIKGSTRREDVLFNIAGILAPVVGVVPTSSVGECWSLEPTPLPTDGEGNLAPWVIANIDNNIQALLLAGIVGMLAVGIIAAVVYDDPVTAARSAPRDRQIGLIVTMAVLLIGWGLHRWWDAFPTQAHGWAAVLMFLFLALGIGVNAWERRHIPKHRRYAGIYAVISALMVGVGIVFLAALRGWSHMVLVLEITEITLFAAFWVAQTVEHWGRDSLRVAPDEPGLEPEFSGSE
ncbi:MAG: hypothetical protein OES24_06010 [Acidimicrobiia bacterium]|nr:hypothetical protein [Acidimicrobiia bacterium]